jgi:hypothetical protein
LCNLLMRVAANYPNGGPQRAFKQSGASRPLVVTAEFRLVPQRIRPPGQQGT